MTKSRVSSVSKYSKSTRKKATPHKRVKLFNNKDDVSIQNDFERVYGKDIE